jgi:hypothetical protein
LHPKQPRSTLSRRKPNHKPAAFSMSPELQKRILLAALGLICLVIAAAVALLFWPGQADEDFKWFGTLGWPDVKGKPLVRVLSKTMERDIQISKKWDTLGFLLNESTNSFTVLTLDLRTKTYAPYVGRMLNYFEPVEIIEEAETFQPWQKDDKYLPGWAQGFVLAWGCERHGYPSPARNLYQKVGAAKNKAPMATNLWQKLVWRTRQIAGKVPRSLSIRQQLELDLALLQFGSIVLDFGKPAVSRSELLQRFEELVKHYPGSPRVKEAQDYIGQLKQLIHEDEAHALALKPWVQMTREERIKELVFQLRNQTEGFPMGGGGWQIFAAAEENTPAHQLHRLGYVAAAELIRALKDNRPTRVVNHGHNIWYPVRVVTVGECAEATLARMFDGAVVGVDLRGCSTSEQVYQRYWEVVQARGLKQVLMEGLKKGARASVNQAEQLLNLDPSALVEVLPAGYEKAQESYVKSELLRVAGRVPGNGLVSFMRGQLEETNSLGLVVVAARSLFLKGDEQMVPFMMRRLEKLPLTTSEDDALTIMSFLTMCLRKEALVALAKDLSSRPLKVRFGLVELLRPGGEDVRTGKWLASFWNLDQPPTAPDSYLAAVEALLVQCLEDTGEEETSNGAYDGKVRVCDCAGRTLAERWKGKYQFDFWASRAQRDRQRLECIRAWQNDEVGVSK